MAAGAVTLSADKPSQHKKCELSGRQLLQELYMGSERNPEDFGVPRNDLRIGPRG